MRLVDCASGNQVEISSIGASFPQAKAKRQELRSSSAGIGHNHPPADPAGEEESIRFLYVQLHIGDYITGTIGMTPELEGAYCRFLVRLYQRGRAFPDDDRVLCAAMGLTIRVWKRLKETLVSLGKIVIRNGCLTNDRFEKERVKRAEMLRKQAEAAHARHAKSRAEKTSLPQTSAKLRGSLPQTSAKLAENFVEKSNGINETEVSGTGCPRILESDNLNSKKIPNNSRLSESQLAQCLELAAGAALRNPAASPGLLVLSTPRSWLAQGCDLEIDILPVIRAVSSKRPRGSIGDWGYFTRAIAEARVKRTVELPQVDSEAIAEQKRLSREKLIRKRASMLGIDPETYRERLTAVEKTL